MEVSGLVQVSLGILVGEIFQKIALNQYWYSGVYSVCRPTYTLLKVVGYYDVTVLSILVRGFQKKIGWGVGGWGELYPIFWIFWIFLTLQNPLTPLYRTSSYASFPTLCGVDVFLSDASILISAKSTFSSCSFFTAHVSAPYQRSYSYAKILNSRDSDRVARDEPYH